MLMDCILLPITVVRTFFGFPPEEFFWTDSGPEIGSPGDHLNEQVDESRQARPVDGTHAYLDKFEGIFPKR